MPTPELDQNNIIYNKSMNIKEIYILLYHIRDGIFNGQLSARDQLVNNKYIDAYLMIRWLFN